MRNQKGCLWLKRRFWMAPALVLAMALLALAPFAVSAWGDWDGIDPVIGLDGADELSIYVEWPSSFTCDVGRQIVVAVGLSARGLKSAQVKSESSASFTCDDGIHLIQTHTTLVHRKGIDKGDVWISGTVGGSKAFPVKVHVSVNGSEVQVIKGTSNKPAVKTVEIDDDGEDEDEKGRDD